MGVIAPLGISSGQAALSLLRSTAAGPSMSGTAGPVSPASSSAALTLLKAAAAANTDPMAVAVGEITRILLQGGGQLIVGGVGSVVNGTDGDDVIYAGPGSSVSGGAGNDRISLIGGNCVASGGAGNDIIGGDSWNYISGDEGDDILRGYGPKNTLLGGSGNDELFAHGDRNTLDGGSGNDRIWAYRGAQDVTGGTGDDFIKIGNDFVDGAQTMATGYYCYDTRTTDIDTGKGSVLHYSVGDGRDTVELYSDSDVTLAFGEGITAENTHIEVQGDRVVITFAGRESDRITVKAVSDSTMTLRFADGTTKDLPTAGPTPYRPRPDDVSLLDHLMNAAYAEH
ncbi:calcium-binding protein [Rhizobium sp. CC-YZS058]|uniref:calcium-binding protein n=1 Tax=Rhizobium sp. CC-YZS058 TaxID=3042153 RepID=UPI002B0591EB|nr:calcium-binding protein [Rhizobium sp. CC-YZS058]MEA3535305.1 calcium-binding protein [Rhizobium sp. CC-YZS058]